MKRSFTRVYRHSIVAIVTSLQDGLTEELWFDFRQKQKIYLYSKNCLTERSKSYITECRSSFPGVLKPWQRKAEYSSPFCNEDKKKRSYTSALPATWLYVVHRGNFPMDSLRKFL